MKNLVYLVGDLVTEEKTEIDYEKSKRLTSFILGFTNLKVTKRKELPEEIKNRFDNLQLIKKHSNEVTNKKSLDIFIKYKKFIQIVKEEKTLLTRYLYNNNFEYTTNNEKYLPFILLIDIEDKKYYLLCKSNVSVKKSIFICHFLNSLLTNLNMNLNVLQITSDL